RIYERQLADGRVAGEAQLDRAFWRLIDQQKRFAKIVRSGNRNVSRSNGRIEVDCDGPQRRRLSGGRWDSARALDDDVLGQFRESLGRHKRDDGSRLARAYEWWDCLSDCRNGCTRKQIEKTHVEGPAAFHDNLRPGDCHPISHTGSIYRKIEAKD